MRVLVSAGPTREWLDDVRFLSNESSGVMGYSVAEAARDRGHDVTLVSGPTALSAPAGVSVRSVQTALEMHRECLAAFADADAAVMVAAVADYRPENRTAGKIKKVPDELVLRLVRNPDILADLGRLRAGRPVVGFALESAAPEEALRLAREKLRKKGADLIVLNAPSGFGRADAQEVVLVSEGGEIPLGRIGKKELAVRLVRYVEEMRARGGGAPISQRP